MNESLLRNFKIKVVRGSGDDFKLEATISTEYPVERGYGNEILIHKSGSIDLSRAPLPLIVSHDTDELNVGVVDGLRIVGRKLKGFLRLGKSKQAKEILEDMKAGILINLSIGYQIIESHFEGDDLIATRWAPYEVSVVSVPADPGAGIGRSKTKEKFIMSIEDKKRSRSQRSNANRALEDEQVRVDTILLMGEKYDCDDLARQFVREKKSIDDMTAATLDKISRSASRSVGSLDNFSNGLDSSQYSVKRALQAAIDPRSVDAGYEMEVSQELSRRMGKKGNSILVPIGYPKLQSRSMNLGTIAAGGAIVHENYRPEEFIDALVAESAIMNLPITTFNETEGDLVIPKGVSNPSAGWYDLDDQDIIAESEAVLDEITFTPHSVAALVPLSRKLVNQSSPDADSLIQRMLAAAIGEELDKQCVRGTGVGSIITGITATTGIGAPTYTNGGNPTWTDIVNLEAELTTSNISMQAVAYLIHPLMAAILKTTEKSNGTGKYILEDGVMNGYRVQVSSNVPVGMVLIGAWREFVLATWGVLALDVDPFGENFAKGNVSVRAILDVDAGVRQPGAFAILTEAA